MYSVYQFLLHSLDDFDNHPSMPTEENPKPHIMLLTKSINDIHVILVQPDSAYVSGSMRLES